MEAVNGSVKVVSRRGRGVKTFALESPEAAALFLHSDLEACCSVRVVAEVTGSGVVLTSTEPTGAVATYHLSADIWDALAGDVGEGVRDRILFY